MSEAVKVSMHPGIKILGGSAPLKCTMTSTAVIGPDESAVQTVHLEARTIQKNFLIWVWLNIGLRGFWCLFPYTKMPFWVHFLVPQPFAGVK